MDKEEKQGEAATKPQGRPSGFNQEIAAAICERLADGESLRAICRDEAMPNKATVFRWLAAHPSFSDQYARAKEASADAMADDILAIADDGQNDTYVDDDGFRRTDHDVIARSKLRVEARKWIAAKLKPKVYGDRVQVDNTHSFDAMTDEELLEMRNKMLEKMGVQPQK